MSRLKGGRPRGSGRIPLTAQEEIWRALCLRRQLTSGALAQRYNVSKDDINHLALRLRKRFGVSSPQMSTTFAV